ncbi:lytic transglycosylase domain-containing protein [Antarcticibacterium flavum]|uniref:Lytic transglycosylase domain-containing protein n=1 Tax=Antarcticibacterium flavum TaxID=2058175 RepID=A0A5B7X8X5_9FLAO|nr:MULTISPECIES: lytic transglycosylase domain-containing protein [Antarcticibacterium]MCM4160381.1 murein transglycosylase [Antarcticibacterium sp. W02-3]QCY71242.1 lytic transglycosylase domain-containing protein [Antarcticibacterium flavum]
MKILKVLLMSVGLLAISAISIQAVQEGPYTEETEEETTVKDKVTKDYNVYALPMPQELSFAGEEVPLEDPDVYERMDRELLVNTYWQSNALLLMKRAHKYFPVIEPILKEYGVPDDFKYLAVIESSLTQAVSPARATGFWQIMEGTGKDYKLEINSNVDERYHIEKSTRVACEYFLKSREQFGSWTMAAAAYNAGNAGISRQLTRQDVSDYYDLLLGEETGRYVFRILAVKEIMKDPKKYGFNFTEDDLYSHIPTYTVKVNTPVEDFASFAKEQGINYKILKIHNPWLREAHLNNKSGKVYEIEIPHKGYYRDVK